MVASRVFVNFRRASKLRRHHHERRVEHPAPVEVANERGKGFVKSRQLALDAAAHICVMIPSAINHRNKTHPALDQPTRHEHPHSRVGAAIFVFERIRLGF